MDSEIPNHDKGLARKLETSLTIEADDDDKGKDYTIRRSKTLSTAATFESQSSLSSLGTTPITQSTTESGFSFATTPEDQKINRWTDKCISPTMLIDHDEAMSALESDGADRQNFYVAAPRHVKACIQYVYGLDIYSDLKREDRLQKISNLVKTRDSRERLASIVFALPKNSFISEERKEAYLQMAITSYLFGHHKKLPTHPKRKMKILGGFPNKAIMLTQNGRNCFHPATVLWISLTEQLYKNHDKILDAAQVARRYLMKNRGELEGRVVDNKGKNTVTFAKRVSNKEGAANDWNFIDCSDKDGESFYDTETIEALLVQEMKNKKFGLMTGFQIKPQFEEAARLYRQRQKDFNLGFFLFDVDATGNITYEWESYDHYKKDPKFRQNLKDLKNEILQDLREQDEKETERRKKLKKTFQDVFPAEGGHNPNISDAENGWSNEASPPSPQSSGAHAMTIVCCQKERSKTATFFACNPWLQMPIVGVTAAFLRVCDTTVCFCSGSLSIDQNLGLTSTMTADCVSYEVEGGGDSSDFPKDWLRDAFGYTCSPRPPVDVFEMLYNGK